MLVSRLIIERNIDEDDEDIVSVHSEPPGGIPFIEALGMLSIAESLIKNDPGVMDDDEGDD